MRARRMDRATRKTGPGQPGCPA